MHKFSPRANVECIRQKAIEMYIKIELIRKLLGGWMYMMLHSDAVMLIQFIAQRPLQFRKFIPVICYTFNDDILVNKRKY